MCYDIGIIKTLVNDINKLIVPPRLLSKFESPNTFLMYFLETGYKYRLNLVSKGDEGSLITGRLI